MARTPPRLGRVQYQVMQELWKLGRATARQLTEELCRSTPVAHSTVQTLLRQLEAKGAVAHDIANRTFIYRPLFQQAELTENPLRELLARIYQGSVVNLMSHLLRTER